MAQSGEWIYFTEPIEKKLFKIKTDGTSKTELLDRTAGFINIIGDWVYFVQEPFSLGPSDNDEYQLFKIKTDGSGLTKVIDESTYQPVYDGTWIYYGHYPSPSAHGIDDDKSEICRIKPDGTERKVIVKGTLQFNLENGWIYYSRFENETYAIYKIKVDGSGQTKVSDDAAYSILVEDGWIYFFPESAGGGFGSSNPVLYRMKTDGTARCRVGKIWGSFNISGDWIYYGDENSISKLRTDGTGLTIVADVPAQHIYTFPDRIYYLRSVNEADGASAFFDQLKLHWIKPDGKEPQTFGEGASTMAEVITPTTALLDDYKMGETAKVGNLDVVVDYVIVPTDMGWMSYQGQESIGYLDGLFVAMTIRNNGPEPVTIGGSMLSLVRSGTWQASIATPVEVHQAMDQSPPPLILPAQGSARYTFLFTFMIDEFFALEKGQYFVVQVTDGSSQAQPVKIGITPIIYNKEHEISDFEQMTPAIARRFADWSKRSFLTYWKIYEKDGAQYELIETWQDDFTKSEYFYFKRGTAELYEAVRDPAQPDYTFVPGKRLSYK